MAGRRTKAEIEVLDQKIRPLYERGVGCRVIGQVLDENPVMVLKRVRRMGIVRTRDEAHPSPVPDGEVPFAREPGLAELRRSAIGTALRWFLERGYMVSVPVEPTAYDLVVESDAGFQRVQVKTTTQLSKRTKLWFVHIARKPYDPSARQNAGGRRKTVPYTKDDIDHFFIVTGDRSCFLVPVEVVRGRLTLTLDERFSKYRF